MWPEVLIGVFLFTVIAGTLFSGTAPTDTESENSSDAGEAEAQYAEYVSADSCDQYWDPPGDNV